MDYERNASRAKLAPGANAMTEIVSPFAQFFDTSGAPLNNGNIYIGTANLDAQSNPIPVYWDEALTIPAAQPLRTLNGYIVRNGTPARIFTNADNFSMTVQTGPARTVWSVQDATSVNIPDISGPDGSSIVGFIRAETGAVALTAEDKLREHLSLKDFGAVGDGVADDTAAVNRWFAAVLATGQTGYAPAGTYKCTSPIVFDYVSKQFTGFTLVGDGVQKTLFASTVSTPLAAAFSIVTSGGSIAVPAIGVYPKIYQIGFLGSFAGSTLRVGYPDYSDQQNLVRLECWISNSSDSATANCLEMNGSYGCNIQYNGGLGQATAAGDNLRLRKCAFSEFFVSLGSTADAGGNPVGTATGVRITNSFNYGNVFLAPDLEILDVAVRIESASAVKTRFIGGTIAGCRTAGVIATAGSDNEFFGVSPNLDPAVPFFGGGTNAVGVKRSPTNVLQIEAPSSGGTVNISEYNEMLKLTTGTLAALTINLPRNPGDTQRVRIQTVGAITALTLGVGRVGDTIFDPVTTLAANSAVEYQYQAGGAQWLRIA
jgi:hypothetical protein